MVRLLCLEPRKELRLAGAGAKVPSGGSKLQDAAPVSGSSGPRMARSVFKRIFDDYDYVQSYGKVAR